MEWNRRIGPALLIAGIALGCNDASAGRTQGRAQVKDVVQAEDSDVYQVWFTGQEPARVQVWGDGDSDLDLYVYDDDGNLICRDDDATDYMVCAWMPRYTGMFTVEIRNLGDPNAYTLNTN